MKPHKEEVLAVPTHEPNFHFSSKTRRKQQSPSPVAAATKLVQAVIAGHHDPPGQRAHLC